MHESNERMGVTDVGGAVAFPTFAVGKPRFPRIDDHLVEPEVSRFELIRGRKVDVSGSKPPHADAQVRLAILIDAHVVAGFTVASELLTRMAESSDFATDVCIRKDGIDPETDTRYLEEIAFEICNTQRRRNVTEKCEDMVCRGVRRAFAIFLKTGQVGEWSAAERAFVMFDRDAVITDPLFVRPIPVQALLDHTASKQEAVLALIAKRTPALVKHEKAVEQRAQQKGRKEGRKEGLAEGHKKGLDEALGTSRKLLLGMVKMRNGHVSPHVQHCVETADAATIQAWSDKLLAGDSIDEVFGRV